MIVERVLLAFIAVSLLPIGVAVYLAHWRLSRTQDCIIVMQRKLYESIQKLQDHFHRVILINEEKPNDH